MRRFTLIAFVLTALVVSATPLTRRATPVEAIVTTVTFSFTGAQQNFVVPAGVTSITIEASGAQGGPGGNGGAAGANGGSVTATVSVTPTETLAIFVGGQGGAGGAAGGTAGFNSGGVGGNSGQAGIGGGGGGGASDVRQGGSGLGNRIVVAGAGGGGGGTTGPVPGAGGPGGGLTGSSGGNAFNAGGGAGGTQAAGGGGGTAGAGPGAAAGTAGASGSGGAGATYTAAQSSSGGGGGGSGYFGGGGGGSSQLNGGGGGGGGSSFTAAGATGVSHTQGNRAGDGQVVITYASPTTTTITSHSPNPSQVGENYTVQWQVTSPDPGTPTGTATLTVDGVSICTVALAGGAAQCTFSSNTVGTKSLVVTYSGDANFAGSVSPAVSHTVNPATTATAITSDSPDPSVVGENYTVQWQVTSSSPGTPTGTTTLTVDGISICTVALAGGAAQCTFSSSTAGTKSLVVTYSGDANFAGSVSPAVSHTVNPASTTTSITNGAALANPSVVGQSYTVQWQVNVTPPGSGTPTGTVTVTIDGAPGCTAPVGAGQCNASSSTVGTKSVVATYNGDPNFSGSVSPPVSHPVSAASPPSVSKAFGAPSIPLGGTTSLALTITNPATVSLTGVAVTDNLPAGLVVAAPNGATNSCGGALSAPAGGSSVQLSGGTIAAGGSCAVGVNVTGTTAGLKANVTSAVTSN